MLCNVEVLEHQEVQDFKFRLSISYKYSILYVIWWKGDWIVWIATETQFS